MRLVELWPDEDQPGGNDGRILKRKEEQFGLIADLLESVHLVR